jgi:hypothetical protein
MVYQWWGASNFYNLEYVGGDMNYSDNYPDTSYPLQSGSRPVIHYPSYKNKEFGAAIYLDQPYNFVPGQTLQLSAYITSTFTKQGGGIINATTSSPYLYTSTYVISNVFHKESSFDQADTTSTIVTVSLNNIPAGDHVFDLMIDGWSIISGGYQRKLPKGYGLKVKATSNVTQVVQTFTNVTYQTFNNNSIGITVPANNLNPGLNTFQLSWNGKTTIPKYYGTDSNVISYVAVSPSKSAIKIEGTTVRANPYNLSAGYKAPIDDYYAGDYFTQNSYGTSTNTATITAIVVGSILGKPPTGPVNLYDGSKLLATGNIRNYTTEEGHWSYYHNGEFVDYRIPTGQEWGEVILSWNPTTAGQLVGVSSGTYSARTLTLQYGGDGVWNTAATQQVIFRVWNGFVDFTYP